MSARHPPNCVLHPLRISQSEPIVQLGVIRVTMSADTVLLDEMFKGQDVNKEERP